MGTQIQCVAILDKYFTYTGVFRMEYPNSSFDRADVGRGLCRASCIRKGMLECVVITFVFVMPRHDLLFAHIMINASRSAFGTFFHSHLHASLNSKKSMC